MSSSMAETDSIRRKLRPVSEPNIDEKSLSLVGGLNPKLVDAWSQRCAFVVDEILQTERDYVDCLHDVIQGYRVPLVSRLKSSSDTQKLVSTLFGNIDDLHGLHMSLLKKLRAHDTEPREFGQVFIETEDGFKLYTGYCTNCNSAMLCLQQLLMSEKHNQFFDQCQRNLKHALPLSAQLIKPVQRITRYHLLLRDLVKHFNPNHYGYRSLKQAHQTMARIADHINKVKKQEENAKRVEHLQTSLYGWKGNEGRDNLSVYGELLLESTCDVGVKKGTERQVLLFEKLLLILKKKDTKRYNYKAHIVASELGLDDTLSSSNRTCFKIYCKTRRHITYTVDPRSNSKRTEWVNAIKDLVSRTDTEDEYERFIKRQKLDGVMATTQRSPVPQRIEAPKRVRVEHSNVGLHERISSQRKRRRGDVRQLFGQQEGVQLVNVRRAVTDESMYQVPTPVELESVVPSEVTEPATSEEGMEHPLSAAPLEQRAESMESLLSLSDVEFGMDEHAGDFDDIDYHRRKIKRRNTDLKRRQAIKVKRSPSNQSLNASIGARIRKKAREAKEDVAGDHTPSTRKESVSDEESELARLMGPPEPMDSSIDQDSLFDSSMDSSTLGQSVGMGGVGGMAKGSGNSAGDEVVSDGQSKLGTFPSEGATEMLNKATTLENGFSDGGVPQRRDGEEALENGSMESGSVVDSGVHSGTLSISSLRPLTNAPPIEIIQDYREERVSEDSKHELTEEDAVFAKVIEDAGIGASPIPDDHALVVVDDDKGDILILEDSSTDSEDEAEEDEGVGFSYSTEFDEKLIDTIPPPPAFAGDQVVPNSEVEVEQNQVCDSDKLDKSLQTKEQLSDFFSTLSRETTPDLVPADVSTSDQPQTTPSEQLTVPKETLPYRFQGNLHPSLDATPSLESIRNSAIYATMPRKKSRLKSGVHVLAGSRVTPQDKLSPKKKLSLTTQPHSKSAARRAEGFSELLQFTREQQCTPLGDMDVSQSLPYFSLEQEPLKESGIPLARNLTACDSYSGSREEEPVASNLGNILQYDGEEGVKSESALQAMSQEEVKIETAPQPTGEEMVTSGIAPQATGEETVKLETAPQPAGEEMVTSGIAPQATGEEMVKLETAPQPAGEEMIKIETAQQPTSEEEVKSEVAPQPTCEEKVEIETTPQPTVEEEVQNETAPQLTGMEEVEIESTSQPTSEIEVKNEITPQPISEEKVKIETVAQAADEESITSEIEGLANTMPVVRPEFSISPLPDHTAEEDLTKDRDLSPPAADDEISEDIQTLDQNLTSLHDDSCDPDQSTNISLEESVDNESTENFLQQNGSPHLRQRTVLGDRHDQEQEDKVEDDVSSVASSRDDRESSAERSFDSHSTLIQPTSMTLGMFEWLQRIFRRSLYGLVPPLGLRGGLLVVGLAAISSLVVYNLIGQ